MKNVINFIFYDSKLILIEIKFLINLVNGKAIQTIIGLCIICVLFIIFLITTIVRYIKNKKRKKEDDEIDNLSIKTFKTQTSYMRQISKIVRQKSIQIRQTFRKVGIRTVLYDFAKRIGKYFKNRDRNYYNILRFSLILTLTIMQVAFIHWDNVYFRLNNFFINNEKIQNSICFYLSKYLFEELIYSILVIAICILIYLCKTKRPYSYFIMRKYKNYFESSYYAKKLESDKNSKKLPQKKSLNTISPASQFASRRRQISSAVYVIYTYDVLNVLMSVYTDNISSSLFSFNFIINSGGVIIDFLFQILQVFFIGFKYYPILVAADLPDSNIFIYLICTLYLLFIWAIRFFNKAVCSQKQEFARQTLIKLSSNLNEKIINGIKSRYNLTNKLLTLFTDEPNPNEQYLKALKQLIPNIFKSSFGKYEPNMIDNYKNLILLDGLSTPNNYYNDPPTTPIPFYKLNKKFITTTSALISTDRFRDKLLNKTNMNVDILIEDLSKKFDQKWKLSISFMENLPLYIALSYLLTQFSLMFISSCVDRIAYSISNILRKRVIRKENSNILKENNQGINIIFKNMNSTDTQNDVDPDESDPVDPAHQIIKQNSVGFNEQKREINHNYEYIKRITKKLGFYEFNKKDQSEYIQRKKQKSYFIDLFERHVYKNKRHLKYSKQFLNTITVALMIIYFFNLYIIKLSDTLCDLLARLINFLLKYLFSGLIQSFNIDQKHDFKTEFRIACIVTTFIILIQLFQTIRKFHDDLVKMHKFPNFSSLIENYSVNYKKMVRKKNHDFFKNSVVNDSLHFSGFLIAHICYGYVVIFIAIFFLTVCFKFLYYFPTVNYTLAQVILPIIILILFRYFLIEFLVKFLFTKNDNRLYKVAPYYIASYFNFFFDCFLGLATCLSRAWLTNIISFLTLSRIDVSMFNQESSTKIIKLDRAHLCYKSYVRMEHLYNNPTFNGSVELLIDASIQSNIVEMNLKYKNRMIMETYLEIDNRKPSENIEIARLQIIHELDRKAELIDSNEDLIINDKFNFQSFLRLRNLLYLCLVLKKYRKLQVCRYHQLIKNKEYYPSNVETKDMLLKKIESKFSNIYFSFKRRKFK